MRFKDIQNIIFNVQKHHSEKSNFVFLERKKHHNLYPQKKTFKVKNGKIQYNNHNCIVRKKTAIN